MNRSHHLLLVTFLLAAPCSNGQDTLVYRSGQRVVGGVQEIGSNAVRYATLSGDHAVIIVADKAELAYITLQNGQRFTLNESTGPEPSFMERKNLFFVDMLAPALDHATVGYERSLGKDMSLRARIGYIGLWRSRNDAERLLDRGVLLRIGPKFVLPRGTKRYPSARDSHSMAGWYLSPELVMSYWERPYQYYVYPNYYWENGESITRHTFHSSAGLTLTIGRQVMLGDHFTFDIHGGLGYGVRWLNGVAIGANERYRYGDDNYQFSHAFLGDRSPLIASGGINFGYLF